MWENNQYRSKVTASCLAANSDRAYKDQQRQRTIALWSDECYASAVASGVTSAMANADTRKRVASGLIARYKNDPQYAKAVGSAVKLRFADEVYRSASSSRTKQWWLENRDDLMAIFTSAAHREKLSQISKQLWTNAKYVESVIKQRGTVSQPQLYLYRLLDELNITYYKEGPETYIKPWSFDCRIPYQNSTRSLLIEVQSYWHTIDRQVGRDRSKFSYVNKYHPEYDIMYVWDYEFAVKDRTIDRLLLKLGLRIDTVDFEFNNVSIKPITSTDVRSFLDCYHYIGKGRGGRCWGAYLDDQLIACVVVSKALRQNQAIDGDFRELSRLCIHPRYHKKNFGSWLLSRIIKLLKTDFSGTLIAYTDTTLAHTGAVYKAANFKFHHEVPADYWYVDKDGFVMHKKTLYNRAAQMHMSESEFAAKYSFSKKWGGVKNCFIISIG